MQQADYMSQNVVPKTEVTNAAPADAGKRSYSVTEMVYAWLCLAAGYGFCRAFPVENNPFGGFLLVVLLYVVTLIVLRCRNAVLSAPIQLSVLSAVAVSASLILCADATIHTVSYAYALTILLYVVYASGGNTLRGCCSDLLVIDFIRALLVMPMVSLQDVFAAVGSGRGKWGGKLLLRIFLGLLVAVVPTVIVGVLLSYDQEFTALLERIFDFDLWDVFSHIVSVLFGIPVGMYLFGAYISSVDRKSSAVISAEGCHQAWKQIKFVPVTTVAVSVLPVLTLYVIFFISQWKYYVSGFLGKLPEDMTVYSRYAREGFFQLCTVAIINLLILIVMALFTARKTEKVSWVQRLLSIVLSVFTLILISTAIAKMVMYIDCYGLTPKRLYSSWLMIMLAVVFLLVMIRQFVSKLRLLPAVAGVCAGLYTLLALSGTDSLIARYNVDRYLQGTLKEVDVSAMEELGDAAIPELVRLVKELDAQNGTDISNYMPSQDKDTGYWETDEYGDRHYIVKEPPLYDQVAQTLYEAASRLEDDLFSFTVPRTRAVEALKQAGIEVKQENSPSHSSVDTLSGG